MRALELSHAWGTENLKIVEHADPTPGKGEVVVKMRTMSLNFRDTAIIAKGGYSASAADAPSIIPFSDGCGIVAAIGEGVRRVWRCTALPRRGRSRRRRESGDCAWQLGAHGRRHTTMTIKPNGAATCPKP